MIEDDEIPLCFLADYVDWELLPPYLQDAVDYFLAEEAREEQKDKPFSTLSNVLTELDIELEDTEFEEKLLANEISGNNSAYQTSS